MFLDTHTSKRGVRKKCAITLLSLIGLPIPCGDICYQKCKYLNCKAMMIFDRF